MNGELDFNKRLSYKGYEPLYPFLRVHNKAASLESPFYVRYIDDKIDTIGVVPTDPLWVVNIKKSIALLFQFDRTLLDGNVSLASSSEASLFGPCNIQYEITPRVNDTILVTKRKDINGCGILCPYRESMDHVITYDLNLKEHRLENIVGKSEVVLFPDGFA